VILNINKRKEYGIMMQYKDGFII